VKVAGRRLHQLARAGVEVDREGRRVVVHQLSVEPTGDPMVYRMEVECSSGTYIRTLAADLGRALGGGAHLRALRRTAVGSFTAGDAWPLDDLAATHVLSPAETLRDYPSARVDADTARDVSHGRPIDAEAAGLRAHGPWAIQDADGQLLAVYEIGANGRATPSVVIAAS
jgi:tRNA pseudouridine55 synthase